MTRQCWMWVWLAIVVGACGNKAADPKAGSGSAVVAPVAVTPPIAEPSPENVQLARGEYLAAVTACAVCHTQITATGAQDLKKAYAGGLDLPEGKELVHTPNISQSKSSGIGAWTDDQILAVIREGVRPDGSHVHPLMPYLDYNRMTDADGKALVAFLRKIPAIDNVVDSNKKQAHEVEAPKPANTPDPTTDKVKHGEYLATLMHCNMCHTPITDHGPDMAKAYAGGMKMELPMLGTGTLFTSNLTSDPDTGLGKWSEDDLAKALKTMTRPDGKMIQGPMLLYQAYWSTLTDADLHAIAAFIKQLPAIKNAVPPSTFKMKGM